ncbi:MAG: TldD/PmbA family protein [Oligoflexia bacterium]|nr:TldD/PmbA family protein [Oligoflexia bacterium]
MSQTAIIRTRIRQALSRSTHWTEMRYHKKASHTLGILKGEVSEMSSKHYEGIGLRCLIDGTWGFASTGDISELGIVKALAQAENMARELSSRKKKKIQIAEIKNLAKGDFLLAGFDELQKLSWEEKFLLVKQTEEKLRKSSKQVESASCGYNEVFEEKIIMTTDGADSYMRWVRPEFRLTVFAADGAKRTTGRETTGVTGAWDCLFRNSKVDQMIEDAGKSAVEQLKAEAPTGGKAKVILSPGMVGILCHEAIGHTVEADFVLAGSIAAQKLNQSVASELVTLADSGTSEFAVGAGGTLPVDDEGVITKRVDIIKNGKLINYLHNRETASHFGVEPGGNARAWEFSDEPLIRMRNTFIQPGNDKVDEMIAGIKEGYYIDGPEGGQADATGEFMFGASKVRKIRDGKLAEPVQKITVAGQAFEVLRTVDAVSSDFKWDLGAGHCGKGQPAKVDAGGPYLRCELLVGGQQ